MDIVTQGLLGAAIGQAGFQKKLGKKAVFWGMIGGIIPDLDIVSQLSKHNIDHLIWHRSFTHSLWFGPVLGLVLGLALNHYYHRKELKDAKAHWVWLMILAIFTHPLLDLFTSYGTQLLAPFSNHRFVIDALPIVDPFYSVPLLLATIMGAVWGYQSQKSIKTAVIALCFSTLYIGYSYQQNEKAKEMAMVALEQYHIEYDSVQAYPTLFQPWLRRFVAKNATHAYTGELSTLHVNANGGAIIREQPNFKDPAIDAFINDHPAAKTFTWFAMGQVWPQVWTTPSGGKVVTLWDLRYPDFHLYDTQAFKREHLGTGIDALWGIRVHYDASGRSHEQAYQYSREVPTDVWVLWKTIWKKTLDRSRPAVSALEI